MMNYCYECGTELVSRDLDGEGMVSYCKTCRCFRFPIYSTAVSIIVLDPQKKRILLIQQYGRESNILVAGYVNRGESAESAVARELNEEIGINAVKIHFNRSEFFERSNTLMLNFTCIADSDSLEGLNTKEVDKAQWFTFEQAKAEIRPDSLARRFLLAYLSDIAGSGQEW